MWGGHPQISHQFFASFQTPRVRQNLIPFFFITFFALFLEKKVFFFCGKWFFFQKKNRPNLLGTLFALPPLSIKFPPILVSEKIDFTKKKEIFFPLKMRKNMKKKKNIIRFDLTRRVKLLAKN